jgi:SAM-dependent methyltransferase
MDGGRVLDVATGRGQFVQGMIEELRSYREIIGLDVSDAGAVAFTQAFGALSSVHFVQADATSIPFEDESFDTVAVAGSLHHLADPASVLSEMRRVLRRGGRFVLGEGLRDHLTGPEVTHRLFHEWSEEIMGVAFRPTYRRAETLAVIDALGLVDVRMLIETNDGDALDPERISRWDELVVQYLERAQDRPDLRARGRIIRARVHDVGILVARALWMVGIRAS